MRKSVVCRAFPIPCTKESLDRISCKSRAVRRSTGCILAHSSDRARSGTFCELNGLRSCRRRRCALQCAIGPSGNRWVVGSSPTPGAKQTHESGTHWKCSEPVVPSPGISRTSRAVWRAGSPAPSGRRQGRTVVFLKPSSLFPFAGRTAWTDAGAHRIRPRTRCAYGQQRSPHAIQQRSRPRTERSSRHSAAQRFGDGRLRARRRAVRAGGQRGGVGLSVPVVGWRRIVPTSNKNPGARPGYGVRTGRLAAFALYCPGRPPSVMAATLERCAVLTSSLPSRDWRHTATFH
jgi:hypothetical protein